MGSAQSQDATQELLEKRKQKIKECFTKTLQKELIENKGLRTLDEQAMEVHFKKVLNDKCMKPLGLDVTKDQWAAVILKHSACAFTKAIKDGCADPGRTDRRECASTAALKCLKQATEIREKVLAKKSKSKQSKESRSSKKKKHSSNSKIRSLPRVSTTRVSSTKHGNRSPSLGKRKGPAPAKGQRKAKGPRKFNKRKSPRRPAA